MANHGYIALANPTIAEFVAQQPEGTIEAVLYQMDGGILQVEGSSLSLFVITNHTEFRFDLIRSLARLELELNQILSKFEYVEVIGVPKFVVDPAELENIINALDAFPVDTVPDEWS